MNFYFLRRLKIRFDNTNNGKRIKENDQMPIDLKCTIE